MIVDGIHEYYRIHFFQRSLLPLFHYGKDIICNAAYGTIREMCIRDRNGAGLMKQSGSVQMKKNGVPAAMENLLGTNAHLPVCLLYTSRCV